MYLSLNRCLSCCDSLIFGLRYSAKGSFVKKIPILNRKIVHLIDEMFWNMGFKSETQAEKVISIIHTIPIMTAILLIRIIVVIHIIPIILIISLISRCVWSSV